MVACHVWLCLRGLTVGFLFAVTEQAHRGAGKYFLLPTIWRRCHVWQEQCMCACAQTCALIHEWRHVLCTVISITAEMLWFNIALVVHFLFWKEHPCECFCRWLLLIRKVTPGFDLVIMARIETEREPHMRVFLSRLLLISQSSAPLSLTFTAFSHSPPALSHTHTHTNSHTLSLSHTHTHTSKCCSEERWNRLLWSLPAGSD